MGFKKLQSMEDYMKIEQPVFEINARDTWELKTLSDVKEGDFFRLSENGGVYIREDYERSLGKYRVTKAENINAETFKKGSVVVQIGFEY
tara:strand:- start:45 stop:314 length:270 start_codon:yes stop_codon:yes gene_type:complete